MDFFDVGGADPANGDFDKEFAGFKFGDGDRFEAQIVFAAVNDSFHCFGDLEIHELRIVGNCWNAEYKTKTDCCHRIYLIALVFCFEQFEGE
jgi:hypothetical protein